MRTTLTLDDQLANDLKQAAHDSGKSFKQVVNETLRAGLTLKQRPAAKPYRLKPAALGALRPGIDLDKALHHADELEDEALMRKLEQRK